PASPRSAASPRNAAPPARPANPGCSSATATTRTTSSTSPKGGPGESARPPRADEPPRNEPIKEASDYLRGTLAEGLTEEIPGAIVEDDQQLVKFHGMYLQDDRDLRGERSSKKMEKAFAFMLRVRISGGVLTSGQGPRAC